MLRLLLLACASGGASALQVVSEEAANKSVFLLGCSLDRNAVQFYCGPRGGSHRSDFLYARWCYDHDLKVNLGSIFHPGMGYNGDLKPPFHNAWDKWKFRYTTQEILDKHAKQMARSLVKTDDPDLVVVDSSLWDLAVWRMLDNDEPSDAQVQKWCEHDLPSFLSNVSGVFPKSRIAYRTAPTVARILKHEISKFSRASVEKLYECVTRQTTGGKLFGKYDLVDYHAIVQAQVDAGKDNLFQEDGYHPARWLSELYMQNVLKLVGLESKLLIPDSHARVAELGDDEKDSVPEDMM